MVRITILMLMFLGAAGCSGPDGLDEETPSSLHGRFGLVSVGYDHDWASSDQAGLLSTTAQFVRYSAMDSENVARLLGLPLDPRKDLPPLDSCKLYDLSIDLESEEATEHDSRNLQLLEAGDLRVQIDARTVTLSPRHFPWLLPFISGVVYGESQASSTRRVSKVRAISDGGEAVGVFSAQLTSPTLPVMTSINRSGPAQDVTLSAGSDLSVQWQSRGQTADVTYLELRFTKNKQDMALRCQPRDDGLFVIPRAHLTTLQGTRATLDISRLRRASFSAPGLERGELRVTVRDTATLQFN